MPDAALLRTINLMSGLPEDFLDQLAAASETVSIAAGGMIFSHGQDADTFYMITRGKVLFNLQCTPEVTASLGSIARGYSFGWSSLFEGRGYQFDAVAIEPTELIATPGHAMRELMDANPVVGYEFMKKFGRIMLNRLQRRTGQLVRALSREIEVEALEEE